MAGEYQVKPFSFSVSGKVIHGDKVGRTIGFPTANLEVNLSEIDLSPGVYFGECYLENQPNQKWACLPYFGPRLIFGEKINSFEVYIYHFEQEIYDQTLVVKISHKLRDPIDLKNLEELKAQLSTDKAKGMEMLST